MMCAVEPASSARSTTSIGHSGWTTTRMPGSRWRTACTCSGRKRWCTLQAPGQRMTLAWRIASASGGRRVSQSSISSRGMPMPFGRVAPQVLVGEEKDAGALGQRPADGPLGVARSADDAAVPPAEGLQRRRRVDVGDGREFVSAGQARPRRPGPPRAWPCRPGSSRRVGSGMSTRWPGWARMAAVSAMKCTPQKTMNSASVCAGVAGQLERVAPEVGKGQHLVALVVVAQDDQPLAQRRLGRGDARCRVVPVWLAPPAWRSSCSGPALATEWVSAPTER